MKNILVPTDFSDCSNKAANAAISIASRAGAEVHFLHIFQTPVDWVNLPLAKEKLYPEVAAGLAQVKSKLAKLELDAKHEGLAVSTFIVFNTTSDEIEDHVEAHSHDFIVMGSHGKRNRLDVIGSNTKSIIRRSKVPVLIIGEDYEELSLKKVVFASTFEKDALPAFKRFLAFCKIFGTEVHLLFVNVPYNFHETTQIAPKMDVFINHLDELDGIGKVVNANTEEKGIQHYSTAINADLLCVAAHGKTGIMRLISPSVAESLVSSSRLPIFYLNI